MFYWTASVRKQSEWWMKQSSQQVPGFSRHKASSVADQAKRHALSEQNTWTKLKLAPMYRIDGCPKTSNVVWASFIMCQMYCRWWHEARAWRPTDAWIRVQLLAIVQLPWRHWSFNNVVCVQSRFQVADSWNSRQPNRDCTAKAISFRESLPVDS